MFQWSEWLRNNFNHKCYLHALFRSYLMLIKWQECFKHMGYSVKHTIVCVQNSIIHDKICSSLFIYLFASYNYACPIYMLYTLFRFLYHLYFHITFIISTILLTHKYVIPIQLHTKCYVFLHFIFHTLSLMYKFKSRMAVIDMPPVWPNGESGIVKFNYQHWVQTTEQF